jgi:dGTPase
MLTNYGSGLNLTYEVRDGIITHCGESFERSIAPDRTRDILQLENVDDRGLYPATLEGCLVRMVDRIAYLGRDMEDAIKAGLIKKSDIPAEIVRNLGTENGKIIGIFVNDTIAASLGKDSIGMSEEVFLYMNQLKSFNYEQIYQHPLVEQKSQKAAKMVELLFSELERIFEKSERSKNTGYVQIVTREAPVMDVFFNFLKNTNYNDTTPSYRIITDFVAGMTDLFAERTFMQLFTADRVI